MKSVWSAHREQAILFCTGSSGAQQTLSLVAVGQSVSSHAVFSVLVSALLLFDMGSHSVA